MFRLEAAIHDLSADYDRTSWKGRFEQYLSQAAAADDRVLLYCRAARYYYAIGEHTEFARALSEAQKLAPIADETCRTELIIVDAFIACANWRIEESDNVLDRLPPEQPAYAWQQSWEAALRGRNALHKGNFTLAIEQSQSALANCSADPSAEGFANMTLGYAFNGMGRYEEAVRYFNEYLGYTLRTNWRQWIASAHAILAATLLDAGKEDRARIHRDLALQEEDDVWHSFGPSSEWFAHMQLKLEGPETALPLAERSLAIAERRAAPNSIAVSNLLLGRIFFAMGEHDRAIPHFNRAFELEQHLGDVPRMTLYRNTALCLRAMDRKAETAEITWKLWELQRDFDRRMHAALLGYQMRLEEKIHWQKTELLQLRADRLERDLSHTASQLVARTELLTTFRDEINGILRTSSDPSSTIRDIREKLRALPVEEMNWTTFDAQFTSVHPEFAAKLAERYPELSPAEVRLCKLLRLNLKSSEIARLFSLSERTIETQRFAVRKKLGLKRSDNVADALATI